MLSAVQQMLMPIQSGTAPTITPPGNTPIATSAANANNTNTTPALWSKVAIQHGLNPQVFDALVEQESGGNAQAISAAGAIGLTQLMPQTAASLHVNPWNPVENLEGGATYLAEQMATFHGNTAEALAAYNAGPGAVEAYGGIPPYTQTQQYVASILSHVNH